MAVKEFIPQSDFKQTVEKEVRQKPSLDQLTKVESPGKPIPADIIEDNESSSKGKSKKAKAVIKKPKAQGVIKKDSILVITEKPQAAQKIANALGDARKYTDNGVSYFEVKKPGQTIIVASAVGHLLNLDYVKGQHGWPIFNVEWKPSYEKDASSFTKKYYDLLKILSKRAHTFYVATDYDIEGEVIGWNVLRFICGQKSALRMKFSTLTPDELLNAFNNPQKELNWGNAYAGESRHIIDWLYGINLSRALMSAIKTTGSFKILSIGRVQGPALKIIVDREREISAFKPVPYWQVLADLDWKESKLEEPNEKIEFKHPDDIFDKKELEKFKNINEAIADTKKTERTTEPPEPFDLTSLQREAYHWHKMTPSETLSIAQKLYLDGIISYPRTSSQKIPDVIEPKKILKKLSKAFPAVKYATRAKPIEGKKEDPAHPCFTENTEVLLKDDKVKFKDIAKKIKDWVWNAEKKSFSSDIDIDNVRSYDFEKSEEAYSKAYQIWKTPIEKDIIELPDVNLEITKNHPIYSITKNGIDFLEADNISEGDYIFKEISLKDRPYKINIGENILLGSYSKNHQESIRLGKSRILKNYNSLREYISGITIKKAVSLAKIMGFCMGDGHINFSKPSDNREEYPSTAFIGKVKDMECLKKNLLELGFSSYIMILKKNNDYAYLISKDSLFGRLLIALGCPTGDKVAKEFDVPDWIKYGEKEIKSAFIGGLFGAELSKTRIHTNNPRDIRPFTFNQSKIKILETGFTRYLESLKKMLNELNIETSKIKIKKKLDYRKKDNEEVIEGIIDINNNRENLIRFLSTIDFGYCEYKEKSFRKALAYLLYRERIVSFKEEMRKKAQSLYADGMKFRNIGISLGISPHTIKGWLYYKKANKEKHVSIRDIPVYSKFNGEIPKGCISVKIKNKICKKFKGFVYDLEIENTHTYFPNGILVHNCIYPTGDIKDLKDREAKLYELIVKRFISCFCQDMKTANKKITLDSEGIKFTASGSALIEKGWLAVYPSDYEEKNIPDINGNVKIKEIKFEEKETQPPSRYSPTSLVTILEKKNLGTKSTRSIIVDTLFQRGYLDGKSIQATPLGMKLIESLESYSPIIIDENLTRQLEEEMEKMQESNDNLEGKEKEIIEKAKKIISDISIEFKSKEKEIGSMLKLGLEDLRKEQQEANTLMQCPTCKKGNLRIMYNRASRRYFVACSAYPECKQTYSLPPNALIRKVESNKLCEADKFPKLLAIRKGKRPWEFCFNPECPIEKEKKAVWAAKKNGKDQEDE